MQDEERKKKKKQPPNTRVIHWSTFQEVTK